ncbi:MAG: urea transporter [Thermonemataceae bacterium]|nr:urea transporter [Thermonemataceae bacterium]
MVLQFRFWLRSILNSYAQIFFSLNTVLAILIMLVTFINPFAGSVGLAAIILINIFAYLFGFARHSIEEGMFGFNALLLGLALSFEYKFSTAFIFVFFSAILMLLFHTVWLSNRLGKYGLPYLGIPFLLTYWAVYLASGSFSLLSLQEEYIYTTNYVANASKSPIYVFAHSLDTWDISLFWKSYFRTLSATFFQNSVLAGLAIALGLLYFSRIAFILSLLGFGSAFFSFELLGINTHLLTDYLVGSNFIFMAIALGGFYVVPNKWSFLSVLLLTPILTILLISSEKILAVFQLKAFTLSFSLLSILFLFFLHSRWWHKFIQLVVIQYYSAEKTIYKHLSTTKRFKNAHLAKLALPFWGTWKVSQGYEGKITHLGEWSKALDFVIEDEQHKTYQGTGEQLKDYYCYDKPVLAPFDAYIYDILNFVEDNPINNVDTHHNWGNSLILNHQNGLFTQLSHLKKDSIKVRIGDFVTKGTLLATCGSSGRSPEPHLHFQVQLSPQIGSKTYAYPIAYFIEKEQSQYSLKTFEIPKENSLISNVETVDLLKNAYYWQPNKNIKLTNSQNPKDSITWKIFTDAYNRSYLYCAKTKSTLWFANDGTMFYCYDFEGDTNSLLFKFYLANYKILLACYVGMPITDIFPTHHFTSSTLLLLQDIFAPFVIFLKAHYEAFCKQSDNPNAPKMIKYESKASTYFFGRKIKSLSFEMNFSNNQMASFIIKRKNHSTTYLCDFF